jgi:hypothetical protein
MLPAVNTITHTSFELCRLLRDNPVSSVYISQAEPRKEPPYYRNALVGNVRALGAANE